MTTLDEILAELAIIREMHAEALEVIKQIALIVTESERPDPAEIMAVIARMTER
jgi:hypothetical protein